MQAVDSKNTRRDGSATAAPVDLNKAIYALSDALDLVGIDDVGHGKRVGVMAEACARTLKMPEAEVGFLCGLGLLHDIGVSSTLVHAHLVTEFDWSGSQVHCEVGCDRLRSFAPLADMALPVRYHHTRWDALLERQDLSAKQAEYANLIFLVDRVDALSAPHYSDGTLLVSTTDTRNRIKSYAGSYFAPHLVDAFLQASASEAYWLQLEPRGLQTSLRDRLNLDAPRPASMAELKQLAGIFSRIVDAKSPFTAEHSLGVSRLARFIAERMGVGPENCDKIEIAGLLHDLGKLRVPDEVLDKPGALNPEERLAINAHSYETFQILHQIAGFEEVTRWAAYHHEELDGGGYPFGIRGRDLPVEARILRVADIFQAMVQDRPYRRGLSAAAALAFMNDLVRQGRVEAEIVSVLTSDMPGAMAVALQHIQNTR